MSAVMAKTCKNCGRSFLTREKDKVWRVEGQTKEARKRARDRHYQKKTMFHSR